MPFHEVSRMVSKLEFVRLGSAEGANVRLLCRRFGVAPATGYKWLARYAERALPGWRRGRVGRIARPAAASLA